MEYNTEPEDSETMRAIINGVLGACERRVHFIHDVFTTEDQDHAQVRYSTGGIYPLVMNLALDGGWTYETTD